ncbi:MAG: hypothetical protein PHU12_04530 [Candidatus Aenigmarchaeota archaeon]|nr:hypothetical protein [Candidatus Aenigmarchaeota archaeon]
MAEEVFKIRIAHIATIPEHTRNEIIEKVSTMRKFNFQGFVKFIHTNNSPINIRVEPMEGTPEDYFKSVGITPEDVAIF